MAGHRIFGTPFASIYPHYVAKAERKGQRREDVDLVVCWLTGYDAAGLERALTTEVDLETFFAEAPAVTPYATQITGLICGVRVEEVEDPLMQQIRWMDKLVDEVARGKKLGSVLRGDDVDAARVRAGLPAGTPSVGSRA
ncbi:DUF2200 domain-containing protein [Pseudokineococcus lusitanus]|uniref:DUF2200 family protein n=1 Tax=Pseudokineococcus lusitanus TaxID=763993 RepID=A0A3N1HR31_9ACTN|nr:DUF2200 domain-containing protein [Pseudokineococcus lusitanus]ROP44978.1 hypothetical protein EDC03_1108 [Pseudokineococcus lusitanus]